MVLRFFLFASVFLFVSCADTEFNNPYDPESPNYKYRLSCSSSVKHSSSSAGLPLSSVAVSSSSYSVPSSNSAQSSSSVAVYSSSSRSGSSSSVSLSSSSVVPSSSSAKPSSSSSKPSSSSAGNVQSNEKGNDIANYKTVKIGEQVWMAENLNYAVTGSKCYGDDETNCATYGRLYDWSTAMGIDRKYNGNWYIYESDTKYQGICPNGWHIPSNEDWRALLVETGWNGASTALKATNGWSNGGNGQDTYGFSALPGGGSSNGRFSNVGTRSNWWAAAEPAFDNAYIWFFNSTSDSFSSYANKSDLYSIRCLKD